MTDKKLRPTIDELLDMAGEIARDSEAGADRFRAINMLAQSGQSVVALPEPLTEDDVIDRVARVMVAAGADICRFAYSRAFRNHRGGIAQDVKLTDAELTEEQQKMVASVTSLKILYRLFPEIKPLTGGMPKGYPLGRSLAVQRTWLRKVAAQILLDREIDADQALREKTRLDAEKHDRDARKAAEIQPEGLGRDSGA